MQEHGPCHLLQFPDPLFGNSILVVGIDSGKAKTLVAGLTTLFPSIGCEDSIISMVMSDMDAVGEAEVFKMPFAYDGLFCID